MSEKKIVHIALITKNSDIMLTDSLQERAAYAIKDLCSEKGWGVLSITIRPQLAHAELALPLELPNGVAMKEMKDAIANKLFELDPDLKERKKGQLWDHSSVVIENAKGDTEYPKELEDKIQQAIAFAYPGKHPSANYH